MTRYIDGDHLRAWILSRWEENDPTSAYPLKAGDILDQIEREMEYPIVDAVPIKHGKWKEHNDYPGLAYLCSECGYFTTDRSRFCCNCGARMDAE